MMMVNGIEAAHQGPRRAQDQPAAASGQQAVKQLQLQQQAIKTKQHEPTNTDGNESNHRQPQQQQQQQLLDSSHEQDVLEKRYRPQKFCAVCGDKAIACNFNAVTCESCKAFFRRNAFKEHKLKCLFDNCCLISKDTRRFCSKCRLLKCFTIGMKREWILTDEQKQSKRVKIMQNKESKQRQSSISSSTSAPTITSSSSSAAAARYHRLPSPLTLLPGGGGSGGCEAHSPATTVRTNSLSSSRSAGGRISRSSHSGSGYQTSPSAAHRELLGSSTGTAQTRDASTSCPDEAELQLAGGQHCSWSMQCHFCSMKLNSSINFTGDGSGHSGGAGSGHSGGTAAAARTLDLMAGRGGGYNETPLSSSRLFYQPEDSATRQLHSSMMTASTYTDMTGSNLLQLAARPVTNYCFNASGRFAADQMTPLDDHHYMSTTYLTPDDNNGNGNGIVNANTNSTGLLCFPVATANNHNSSSSSGGGGSSSSSSSMLISSQRQQLNPLNGQATPVLPTCIVQTPPGLHEHFNFPLRTGNTCFQQECFHAQIKTSSYDSTLSTTPNNAQYNDPESIHRVAAAAASTTDNKELLNSPALGAERSLAMGGTATRCSPIVGDLSKR